ncbi:hypothetical protein NLG97_g10652 [Lecanicillium saksenae]|uniref:Uncharacterized protein n=1 Tax=Lecanicillium saksenae TaxID=468837 RepID=A0ACC1QCK5_9HYPO|nr:hypothetical protein NLG97_g10652 [Lecanicillium saksenae]
MESIIEGLVKQNRHDSVDGNSQRESHGAQGSDSMSVKRARASKQVASSTSITIPLGMEARTNEELSRYLVSLWPSQPDLDLIINAQVCISVLLHGVVCQPYDGYFENYIAGPHQILKRPPEDAHPVLVARNMLLLVTLLASLPPTSVDAIPGLSITHRDMIEHLYNAATKLVTSNNEFMTCMEGLEGYMMEVMYLTNLGNLRRAWLINRRAIDTAQMMGLQTGRTTSSIVVLDENILKRIRPDYMWFRLVYADRHLSLLLGLPQATTENVFATPEVLETYAPLERFERILCVACSLILQRNNAEHNDLDTTYEIDKTLQRAATLLPPQWWVGSPPGLNMIAGRDESAFQEALRLMNQFVYHHLLVQLHLPYMLLPSSSDPRIDCSKITVANASRSILTRFISFHSSPAATAYCRGIDFIAFIASTTLCLVHIEARRQQCFGQADESNFGLLQPLLHQRLADRGILQRLLDIVTDMSKSRVDPVAKRIVMILGSLLEIELNSFKGGCYTVSAIDYRSNSSEKLGTGVEFGDSSNAPHTLRIKIPFFGTIRIEHHPTFSKSSERQPTTGKCQTAEYVSGLDHHNGGSTCSSDTGTGPLPTPTSTYAVPSQQLHQDWSGSVVLQQHPSALSHPKDEIWSENATVYAQPDVSEPYLLVPGLSNDDWALQGVDIALFSSLTQGS